MKTITIDKVMEGVFTQLDNQVDELGQPQAWLYQSTGRSIEIVEEQDGLQPENYYYSCKIHCNDSEYNLGKYKKDGIVETFNTNSVSKEELMAIVEKALEYPFQ